MAGIVEVGAEVAEVALTFVPALADVPVLGRILLALAPGGGNESKALEDLAKQAQKKETQRKTRIDKNGRYVIRASEAMKCVENNIQNGGFLLTIAKGIINTVLGRGGDQNAPDLMTDRIFTCIEEHVLRQDTPRVIREVRTYHRPSKGHGKGRRTFG